MTVGAASAALATPDPRDGREVAQGGPGAAQRRYPRYLVNLAVRYSSAQRYVEEYADNLSQGGLFVAGAQHHLEPMQEVTVEIQLPGHGSYAVEARVAYVLDHRGATEAGRAPGAGLAIVSAPAGFQEVLSKYLMVLGRRKDVYVLVESEEARDVLSAAGFRVATAPPAERVTFALLDTPRVIGVVVSPHQRSAYEAALHAEDLPVDLVMVAEEGRSGYELLDELDRRVLAATRDLEPQRQRGVESHDGVPAQGPPPR